METPWRIAVIVGLLAGHLIGTAKAEEDLGGRVERLAQALYQAGGKEIESSVVNVSPGGRHDLRARLGRRAYSSPVGSPFTGIFPFIYLYTESSDLSGGAFVRDERFMIKDSALSPWGFALDRENEAIIDTATLAKRSQDPSVTPAQAHDAARVKASEMDSAISLLSEKIKETRASQRKKALDEKTKEQWDRLLDRFGGVSPSLDR